jgi:hypothetical protein
MRKYTIHLWFFSGIIPSLSGQTHSDSVKTKLVGTWVLASASRDSLHFDIEAGVTTQLSFSSDGVYKMRTPDFKLSADYTIEGNTIKLENIQENGIRYKEARWATILRVTGSSLILKTTRATPGLLYEVYRRQ